MKRERAFLQQSQGGSKKPRLASSLAVTATIPRPLGLSQVQKAQVAKLISANEEIKYIDTAWSAYSVDLTGTTAILTATAQGTAQSQRLGSQIKPLSVKLNLSCAAADTTNYMRIIVWQYKGASSTFTPSIPFILATAGAGVQEVISPYNYTNKKLYKILYDEQVALSTQGPTCAIWSQRINLPKKLITDFNAGAASTSAMNHICFSVLSDSAAPTHPTLNGTVRVFYSDA